ncbi:MAG: hypothetical protein ABGY72_03080 [bacterium]
MKTNRPTVVTRDSDVTSTAETGEVDGDRRRGPQRSARNRRQQDLGPPDGPSNERRSGTERRHQDRRVA